jgi:ABC-type transport system substrate-binding protein
MMNRTSAASAAYLAARRHSRRAVLRYGTLGGAGLAGAFALACGSSGNKGSGSGASSAPAQGGTVAAGNSQTASLVGRLIPAPTEAPIRGGVYNHVLGDNPPSLDPHRSASASAKQFASAVYSRLLRFKGSYDVNEANNLDVEPDLALSVESPDALTWTAKLRPNAKFHNVAPVNGHAVEAEDVKVTIQRALSEVNVNRGSLDMIDGAQVETPDKNTVVFKLKYPFANFRKLISSATFLWIFPREVAGGGYDPAKQMIGSGPFIFEGFTPDVAGTFKRNPEWFEKDRPYLDGLKIAIVPAKAQQLAQFTAGNLDQTAVPTEDVGTMKQQNPKADVVANWESGPILYFQLADGAVFRDIRIRQAASLAINREAYGRVLMEDKYQVGYSAPHYMGKWAMKTEDLPADVAQWYTFDLPRARKLLEEAGGQSLDVKLLKPKPYPSDPQHQTSAEMAFDMLKQLPWKISLVFIDYTREWMAGGKGARYGNYPGDTMVWGTLGATTDIDDLLFAYWHSKSTQKQTRLDDPRIDELIAKARSTLNEDEAVKAYKAIQQYIAAQVYSIGGLPQGLAYTMVAPRVRNWTAGDSNGIAVTSFSKVWIKPA